MEDSGDSSSIYCIYSKYGNECHLCDKSVDRKWMRNNSDNWFVIFLGKNSKNDLVPASQIWAFAAFSLFYIDLQQLVD